MKNSVQPDLCNLSDNAIRLLRYPQLSPTVSTVLSVVLSFGVLFNALTLYALITTRINSVLSKVIFYNQSVYNAILCLSVIGQLMLISIQPKHPVSWTPVFCFVFQSGFYLRFVRVLVLSNIVCLSLNRFWAVVYPHTYRHRTKIYLTVCYLFTFLYAFVTSISRVFQVIACDGMCLIHPKNVDTIGLVLIDMILRYVVPVVLIVTLHVIVLRTFRRLKRTSVEATPTRPEVREDESYSTIWNAISISAYGFTAEITLLELTALIFYVLQEFKLTNFRTDSVERFYYVFVWALVAGLNPILEIVTIPPLRNSFCAMIKSFGRLWTQCDCTSCKYTWSLFPTNK